LHTKIASRMFGFMFQEIQRGKFSSEQRSARCPLIHLGGECRSAENAISLNC
jgi:hypothetical protein